MPRRPPACGVRVYDMGDRRTEVTHPASGKTTFTYDALGNVLTKQTAELAKGDKVIAYDYDYHRLSGISYPDHPENNVRYYYGGRNASHNPCRWVYSHHNGICQVGCKHNSAVHSCSDITRYVLRTAGNTAVSSAPPLLFLPQYVFSSFMSIVYSFISGHIKLTHAMSIISL